MRREGEVADPRVEEEYRLDTSRASGVRIAYRPTFVILTGWELMDVGVKWSISS